MYLRMHIKNKKRMGWDTSWYTESNSITLAYNNGFYLTTLVTVKNLVAVFIYLIVIFYLFRLFTNIYHSIIYLCAVWGIIVNICSSLEGIIK